MTITIKAGIASAALAAVAAFAGSATAADLGGYKGGSIKDGGYVQPMPEIVRGPVGPCYFRADVGYAASTNADITWAQTDPVTLDFLSDRVATLDSGNTWFGEAGVGCGSGSRGLRGEVMFGFHGKRDIEGEPENAWFDVDKGGPIAPEQDPLHTKISSYTMMFNAYKDMGNFGGFTPYVGAGVGMAYNKMDEVYFTGNPALVNKIKGDNELSFAWSVMAGVGYQISDRAIIDVGYRYFDMGDANSDNIDNALNYNPRVNVDDLTAHEIKIGLRYHFGSSDCCAAQYVPMK
jgi:opacity protein-like surface antigen